MTFPMDLYCFVKSFHGLQVDITIVNKAALGDIEHCTKKISTVPYPYNHEFTLHRWRRKLELENNIWTA